MTKELFSKPLVDKVIEENFKVGPFHVFIQYCPDPCFLVFLAEKQGHDLVKSIRVRLKIIPLFEVIQPTPVDISDLETNLVLP